MAARVLLIAAHPARGHGLRRLSRLTATAWHQAGAEVTTAVAPTPVTTRLARAGFAGGLPLAARAESAAWAGGLLRRAGDVDLVHVVDGHDAGIIAGLRDHVAVAVTVHDLDGITAEDESMAHPLRRMHSRAVLRGLQRATHLLPTSGFVADQVAALTGRRAESVPLPVDPALAQHAVAVPAGRRAARRDGWRPPTWPYLLTVGGPEPHTRRPAVIEAWSRLRRTRVLDGASLVVVGPALTAAEEELVTACGGHACVLTDVSDSQLAALYEGARALVALGRPRSFPWPVLEAHQAGRPVLATDHELFHEAGRAGCVYLPVEGMSRFDQMTWSCLAEDLTAPVVADRAALNGRRGGWSELVSRLGALVDTPGVSAAVPVTRLGEVLANAGAPPAVPDRPTVSAVPTVSTAPAGPPLRTVLLPPDEAVVLPSDEVDLRVPSLH